MKEQIEKQAIEEMYKDVYEAISHNSVIDLINGGFIGINTDGLTKELYDDGYRRQSVGEWEKRIFIIFDSEKVGYRCSECNTTWDTATPYCPNCGAKMRVQTEVKDYPPYLDRPKKGGAE